MFDFCVKKGSGQQFKYENLQRKVDNKNYLNLLKLCCTVSVLLFAIIINYDSSVDCKPKPWLHWLPLRRSKSALPNENMSLRGLLCS